MKAIEVASRVEGEELKSRGMKFLTTNILRPNYRRESSPIFRLENDVVNELRNLSSHLEFVKRFVVIEIVSFLLRKNLIMN